MYNLKINFFFWTKCFHIDYVQYRKHRGIVHHNCWGYTIRSKRYPIYLLFLGLIFFLCKDHRQDVGWLGQGKKFHREELEFMDWIILGQSQVAENQLVLQYSKHREYIFSFYLDFCSCLSLAYYQNEACWRKNTFPVKIYTFLFYQLVRSICISKTCQKLVLENSFLHLSRNPLHSIGSSASLYQLQLLICYKGYAC